MADYWLMFSEKLWDLTPEEADWLEDQLADICVFEDGRIYAADALPEELSSKTPQYRGPRYLYGNHETSGDTFAGFDFQFCNDRRTLWLYAEDNGDTENVIRLVQAFLRRFRPQDYWVLTYATTCSRPRIAVFDGGIIVVLADEVRHFCTAEARGLAPWIADSACSHHVVISVRNGTVEQVVAPRGLQVTIVDWDTDGASPEEDRDVVEVLQPEGAQLARIETNGPRVVVSPAPQCASWLSPVLRALDGGAEKSDQEEMAS